MASIIPVGEKWRAQVRRKGHATQTKTFDKKRDAEAWARSVEAAIEDGRAERAVSSYTVAEVVDAFTRAREKAGREVLDTTTEHYTLKQIKQHLGHLTAARLTPEDLVGFARKRKAEGAGPYTINMDVGKVGTVLRYGGAALGVVFPDVVKAARPSLSYLRLIGGGGKRERRPTEDELHAVLSFMAGRRGQRFADAVEFCAYSAMRRGEVCDLCWSDIDEATRIATVARKHPRLGKTIERVPLVPGAWAVLQRQPRNDDRVFPFTGSTLSKYFTEACRELGVPDLHLHDMRHEGTSALFEQGLAIPEVALVTGHKDWRHLRRYTNLKPESLVRLHEE